MACRKKIYGKSWNTVEALRNSQVLLKNSMMACKLTLLLNSVSLYNWFKTRLCSCSNSVHAYIFCCIQDAYRDQNPGVNLQYHTDGEFFSVQHLQAIAKVWYCTVCALLSATANKLLHKHRSLHLVSSAVTNDNRDCNNFGLKIHTDQLVVMYESASAVSYEEPVLKAQKHNLSTVKFKYLGRIVFHYILIDDLVNL